MTDTSSLEKILLLTRKEAERQKGKNCYTVEEIKNQGKSKTGQLHRLVIDFAEEVLENPSAVITNPSVKNSLLRILVMLSELGNYQTETNYWDSDIGRKLYEARINLVIEKMKSTIFEVSITDISPVSGWSRLLVEQIASVISRVPSTAFSLKLVTELTSSLTSYKTYKDTVFNEDDATRQVEDRVAVSEVLRCSRLGLVLGSEPSTANLEHDRRPDPVDTHPVRLLDRSLEPTVAQSDAHPSAGGWKHWAVELIIDLFFGDGLGRHPLP